MNDEERKEKLEKLRLIREQKKQKEQFDTEQALSSLVDLELYLEKEIQKQIENENTKEVEEVEEVEEVIKEKEIKEELLQDPFKTIPIEKEKEKLINKKINKITDLITKFNQK